MNTQWDFNTNITESSKQRMVSTTFNMWSKKVLAADVLINDMANFEKKISVPSKIYNLLVGIVSLVGSSFSRLLASTWSL
jgi:hypothetical protein